MTDRKKLTRSRSNWYMSGLCGGLGQFFGLEPTIVRAVLAVLVLMSGALGIGALLYIVLWFVVAPEGSTAAGADEKTREGIQEMGDKVKDAVSAAKSAGSHHDRRWMVGLVVTLVGLVLLAGQMGISLITLLDSGLRLPLAIFVIGILVMSAGRTLSSAQGMEETATQPLADPEMPELPDDEEEEEPEETSSSAAE